MPNAVGEGLFSVTQSIKEPKILHMLHMKRLLINMMSPEPQKKDGTSKPSTMPLGLWAFGPLGLWAFGPLGDIMIAILTLFSDPKAGFGLHQGSGEVISYRPADA
jgi:hypothetical protein